MIDYGTINESLEDFKFAGYAKTTAKLLSSFGISDVTIRKIVNRINSGEYGPFYIYRRAVIFCCDGEDYRKATAPFVGTIPLVIVVHPEKLVLISDRLGEKECQYCDISKNKFLLSPLSCSVREIKDHYTTLELDQLVESLFRTLVLDNNDKEESRLFIFNLLYIAHFREILQDNEVIEIISGYAYSYENKLKRLFKYFKSKSCPYVVQNLESITLSNEAYSYIFPIIRFDTTMVDTEILTSLIYRMVEPEEAGLYGHHTSFVNVDKVLRPLIFDELDTAIEDSDSDNAHEIIDRIRKTTIFDPTNGPGCYLVAAYNGLASRIRKIENKFGIKHSKQLDISHFVGLVTNSTSRDLTVLALAFSHSSELVRSGMTSYSQLNEFYSHINVFVGSQLSDDWSTYVTPDDNLYIAGSPEFKGAHKIQDVQKKEMINVFGTSTLNSADYCSAWLVKSVKFISGTKAKAALVLTNSVSQGAQASFILDTINEAGCEYVFGHRSFKWKTSKTDNVGVTVIVIGIASKKVVDKKVVYDDTACVHCNEIGATLLPDIDIRIKKRTKVLSPCLPEMKKGNMSYCADALIFDADQLDSFLSEYEDAKQFIRPLYGSEEFVKSSPRWCLWITDKTLSKAKEIAGIASRIERVRQARKNSTASKKCKDNPHKFRDTNTTSSGKVSLIVPCVTSEKRFYFQMGVVDDKTIVNNLACVIYDCDIWLLALLESRMHTVWAKNAAGGHETRVRYSCDLCYNTFPVPDINKHQQDILRNLSKTLLEVREKYCDKSIGELYTNMPPELLKVHSWIDATVDSLYRSRPFENDAERLIWLKKLYNNMIENE